eukprot:4729337-Pyramimonas_sp.AAC.1
MYTRGEGLGTQGQRIGTITSEDPDFRRLNVFEARAPDLSTTSPGQAFFSSRAVLWTVLRP